MNKVKKPLVCIVIVNWNGRENITNCLKSLKKTNYENYKIIVLDNGSTDDSIKRIEKFKEVFLLKDNKNNGFASGSNILYSYVLNTFNPDYICNMNNDIITVQPNWLSLMVNSLEKRKNYGICANKLISPNDKLQLLYLDRDSKEYEEKKKEQYDFVKEVSAVGGANVLIKREVFNKIGGTDENYFYGPDDLDYCYRAREKGFKIIYNSLSKSAHIGSFSYLSISKDFIYSHQSMGYMLFNFRWGSKKEKLKMIINQFVRIFLTRKDPYSKITSRNICFHKSFPRRIILFLNALSLALYNYKKIDNSNFKYVKGKKTEHWLW